MASIGEMKIMKVMQFCMFLNTTLTHRHKMMKGSRSPKMQSIISGTCNF